MAKIPKPDEKGQYQTSLYESKIHERNQKLSGQTGKERENAPHPDTEKKKPSGEE